MDFYPYADESAVLDLGGLTLENHLDHIAIYGQMSITKDQQGLAAALELYAKIGQIVASLQEAELPDHIKVVPTVMVKNPFA